MADVRELATALRAIRTNCVNAIEATGEVDYSTIDAQADLFKRWVYDLENTYVEEAKKKPSDADKISIEGRKIVDEAWYVYELLLEVEQTSNEPPRPTKYEHIPSGVVAGETKTALLIALRNLTAHFDEFRRNVLKT